MTQEKSNNRRFWDRYAKLYDLEINHTSKAAYAEMTRRMNETLTAQMDVLEVATGTGLLALAVAPNVHSIIATDFAPKMIEAAKRKPKPQNVVFRQEDATALTFADASFDAVIVSNALHIMPEPEKALREIARVLKPGGVLFAPNFTHGHLSERAWRRNAKFLQFLGFQAYAKWTPEEYVAFVAANGFAVEDWTLLRAAFPLVYLRARKAEG